MTHSTRQRDLIVITAFLLLIPLLPSHTLAQVLQSEVEEEVDRVNYAFAAYLGSGIYTASDGAIQV